MVGPTGHSYRIMLTFRHHGRPENCQTNNRNDTQPRTLYQSLENYAASIHFCMAKYHKIRLCHNIPSLNEI